MVHDPVGGDRAREVVGEGRAAGAGLQHGRPGGEAQPGEDEAGVPVVDELGAGGEGEAPEGGGGAQEGEGEGRGGGGGGRGGSRARVPRAPWEGGRRGETEAEPHALWGWVVG